MCMYVHPLHPLVEEHAYSLQRVLGKFNPQPFGPREQPDCYSFAMLDQQLQKKVGVGKQKKTSSPPLE